MAQKVSFAIVILAISSLVACAPKSPDGRDGLAAEIEERIDMPTGAEPLEAYARHYAVGEDGSVSGIYLIPWSSDIALDSGCDVIDAEGTRPCSADEVKEMRKQEASVRDRIGEAGEVRWHDEVGQLPMIDDGGCTQINVNYVPTTRTVLARCNGHA